MADFPYRSVTIVVGFGLLQQWVSLCYFVQANPMMVKTLVVGDKVDSMIEAEA